MSLLDTDLSLSPYFDDYSPNSNHYAVLYRPGVPVQARELNEVQSIIQDQIYKFGSSIYKEGSVIDGCAFSFDNQHSFVKINDNYANGTAFTIAEFIGNIVYNSNGLKATIVDASPGYQVQDPNLNTLYVKYLNSGAYANGSGQSAFAASDNLTIATTANVAIGNVTVANVANPTGYGYAMYVTEGSIFKKGYFIRVPSQSVVVTKYNNVPDGVSVGFGVIEFIETPESNTSLYDNAAGSPNEGAPGAHRLTLTPNMVVKNTADISNTTTFFSLCDFQGGLPVTIKTDPQYSALGTQLAQRTFETNGDFVVNPFILSVNQKVSNDSLANTYLNLVSSAGLGYAKGYRVDTLNNYTVNLRKGTDYESLTSQYVSTNFGYYVNVSQMVGDFNLQNLAQVEIHSVAKTAITSQTFLGTSYSSTTKIGTAYIRGIEYASGTPGVDAQYSVYLFDIQMLPGFNFNQAKSIISYPASLAAVADIVLTYDYPSNTNIAVLQEIVNNTMVFPLGQKAVKQDSFQNGSYIYRDRANSSFGSVATANATMALPLPTRASGADSESFLYSGTLTAVQAANFIVIPTQNGASANNPGNVAISNLNGNVIGTSTTFTTNYNAGDFITINSQTKQILSIANDTFMTVNGSFSSSNASTVHSEAFPAGLPISFINRNRRSISISGSTATFNLGSVVGSAFNSSVYYDLYRTGSSLQPIKKTINRNTLIKIQANTNSGGISGPWCLGLPDVLNLNHVWMSTNGTYSNTATDLVSLFQLDNGQRDSHYDLATLKSTFSALPANALLLISVDNFTATPGTTGVSYFSANSYPIDDVNTSNTAAITTAQIPLFYSPSKGTTFDLRDSIDFRPFGANTAAVTNAIASATVNPSSTLSLSVYSSGGRTASYMPTPNMQFRTDLAHYLPRRDRVAITTSGALVVTEGAPGFNPNAKPELPGTMSLAIIDVPPYPTISPAQGKLYNRYDYATTITLVQSKRYTMADIGSLDDRIGNLEYYTALNLLEQSASNLQVRSTVTGQNRFKNGILVDPFRGHDIGNTLDPQYNIAIDPGNQQARPFFKQWNRYFYVDKALSTNYIQRGHTVTIAHSDLLFQQQPYASKYHNCIEGNVYDWRGTINLYPSGDTQPDTTVTPDVVNNLDLASNFVNLNASQGWGTTWGNWVTTSASVAYGSAYQTGASTSITNADGSVTTSYQTQINTTTTLQQVQSGSQLGLTVSNTALNLGTYVTDISINPYISSKLVFFSATGMKPNTIVYPFFGSTPVGSFCQQVNSYFGAVTTVNNISYTSNNQSLYVLSVAAANGATSNLYYSFSGNYGNTMVTSNTGTVTGLFLIPAATFKATDTVFKLADVSDLVQGANAISTESSATYVGSGLSVSYGRSILNTRQATVSLNEVTNQQTIQVAGAVASAPIVITTAPPPPQPYNYGYQDFGYQLSDNGNGAGNGSGDGSGGP